MSELALAQRFQQLASDYDNRPVVVRRGTLKSVLRFLNSEDWEIKHTAASTILLLAKHPDNKEPMCREKGLIDAVFEGYRATEETDPRLHELFAEIFDELREVLAAEHNDDDDDTENVEAAGSYDGNSIRTVRNRSTRVRQGASVSSVIILEVGTLSPATHDELESLLQTIRGIVSYTIDVQDRSVRIFGSVALSGLKAVLLDGGFDATLRSQETIEAPAEAPEKPQEQPTYRSAFSKLNIFGDLDWRRTIVLHGIEGNSLQARLERQKEERNKKHQTSRSAMANILGTLKSWW